MKNQYIELVEAASQKENPPEFEIGDQVEVHQRILEGEKERTQVFSGVVISKRGEGMREMFTVRRIVQGEGVERTFPLHSPRIAKVDVKRTGAVRRAKLYYLRDRVGKATRPQTLVASLVRQPLGTRGGALPQTARLPHCPPQLPLPSRRNRPGRPRRPLCRLRRGSLHRRRGRLPPRRLGRRDQAAPPDQT